MEIGFEVTGIDELMNSLKTIANPDFADQALRKGLTVAGKQVQGTAKALCPVDTGDLRNSIVVTQIKNGIDIGTNKEYALCVEYGTGKFGDPSVQHTTKEKWTYKGADGKFYTTSGQSPQPFLYPALKANKDNIDKIVSDTLESEISKAVVKRG